MRIRHLFSSRSLLSLKVEKKFQVNCARVKVSKSGEPRIHIFSAVKQCLGNIGTICYLRKQVNQWKKCGPL